VLPPAPPLSTVDRERRRAEMELLAALAEGDGALGDLWGLWVRERGAGAAASLVRAEALTARGPAQWTEAERVLRRLIGEHGVHWAEPVNRLATLCFLQGRYQESEMLCKTVLAVKPWHFGALSGIVMVYAARRDSDQARQWAARRLPVFAPTGPNRRRLQWVQKALGDAHESYMRAEKALRDSFGKPDDHTVHRKKKKKNSSNDNNDWTSNDDDAWQ
jgi:hypothetical protein